MTGKIPIKTIERLSLYRRILRQQAEAGMEYMYSHQLAELVHKKPAQVRRDISYLEEITSTSKGYRIDELIRNLGFVLDAGGIQHMALVGIGHMGKAFINFFKGRGKNLKIIAAFDIDPEKINRVVNGCRCYHMDDLEEVVAREGIDIGIITVPEAKAREVYERMIRAGITAMINAAPVPLESTEEVFVTNLDLTTFFEKAVYFAYTHSVGYGPQPDKEKNKI
jgi:redox-sensing transcriptional repressor